MNSDILFFALFVLSAFGNVALGTLLLKASKRAAFLEARDSAKGGSEEQLAHLEEVVHGIASQLDELASGQEFLNRVVAERLGKPAPGSPPALPPSNTLES